ncbi:MAG: N-acetyl-gamma-glutamyl-phosphate reductase [Cellvibrionales bacterium]|nr:N-acetyl-gamma-glutamyl-phosphate reductase [Cellvibrionales bacterium]
MIRTAIVGGTGYTGLELVRLLAGHPQAELCAISARTAAGQPVAECFPSLRGHCDLVFCAPEEIDFAAVDLVFFATPHGVAQASVPQALAAGARVIDLSADFRLRDPALWQRWYGQPHQCPELLAEAVYGLPEIARAEIAKARLVACPGCYPTAIQLGLLPLLRRNNPPHPPPINLQTLIANAASGVTGAGRQAKVDNLFAELADSFKAYAVAGHRHLPEIEQGLQDLARAPVALTFVPHLLPVNRGILATIYADLAPGTAADVRQLYDNAFAAEPFVDLLPPGQQPSLRAVRGTNRCQIAIEKPQDRNRLVITAAIDNLVKGAAGQALQNMNIMGGLPEASGLQTAALIP